MWAPNNSVNMDDLRKLTIIDMVVSFNSPHPHVLINFVTDVREPVHKSTMVFNTIMLEREENADLGNINA